MSDRDYNDDGLSLYMKKKYEDAIKKFNLAIQKNQKEPLYYRNKGFCYYHLGKYEEAIKEYNNALNLAPDNASYINNIGNAYLNLGKYEEAYEAYKKANELDPQEKLYINNLSNVNKELIKNNPNLNYNNNGNNKNNNSCNNNNDFGKNESKEYSSRNDSIENISGTNNKRSYYFNFNDNNNSSYANNNNDNQNKNEIEENLRNMKIKELDLIFYEIKTNPNCSEEHIKRIFKEIKNCSKEYEELILNKFLIFLKGLAHENYTLKEKFNNIDNKKLLLKSEFERSLIKMNEMQKLSPLKITNVEYSINLENIDMNKFYITQSNDSQQNNENQSMDYYTCKFCYSIVKDPICCSQCDDLFCSFCLKEWINDGRGCPHCRAKPFKESRINKFNKNFLNNIQIICPVGCEDKFKYEYLNNHLKTCKKTEKIYLCKLCNYEIKFEIKNENNHTRDKINELSKEDENELEEKNSNIINENEVNRENDSYEYYCKELKKHSEICPEIIFECCYCNENIKNFNVPNHLEICFNNSKIKCEICRMQYPKKHMKAHKEYFCKKVIEMNNLYRSILDK